MAVSDIVIKKPSTHSISPERLSARLMQLPSEVAAKNEAQAVAERKHFPSDDILLSCIVGAVGNG